MTMISLATPTAPRGSDPLSSLSRSYRQDNAELWNLLRKSQQRLAEMKSNNESSAEEDSDFEFGWTDEEEENSEYSSTESQNNDKDDNEEDEKNQRDYEQEHREVRDLLLQSKRRLSIIFHEDLQKDPTETEEETDSFTAASGEEFSTVNSDHSEFDSDDDDNREEGESSISPLGKLWTSTRNIMTTLDESFDPEKKDNDDDDDDWKVDDDAYEEVEEVDETQEFINPVKNSQIITREKIKRDVSHRSSFNNNNTLQQQHKEEIKTITQQEVSLVEEDSPPESFMEEVEEIGSAISSFWNATRSSTKNAFKAAIDTVKDEISDIKAEVMNESYEEDQSSVITESNNDKSMGSSSILQFFEEPNDNNDTEINDPENFWNETTQILAGMSPVRKTKPTVESQSSNSPIQGGLWSATKNILAAAVETVTEELDDIIEDDDLGEEEQFISSTSRSTKSMINMDEAPRVTNANQKQENIMTANSEGENQRREWKAINFENEETPSSSRREEEDDNSKLHRIENDINASQQGGLWSATKNIFVSAVQSVTDELNEEFTKTVSPSPIDIPSISEERKSHTYSVPVKEFPKTAEKNSEQSDISVNLQNVSERKSLKQTAIIFNDSEEFMKHNVKISPEQETVEEDAAPSIWGGFSTWSRLQKLGDNAAEFLEL